MKKLWCVLLCVLLLLLFAGASAAGNIPAPYCDTWGVKVYDNDTVTLTAHCEGCEKLEINYGYHDNHQEFLGRFDVPSGASTISFSVFLFPKIPDGYNDNFHVSLYGYYTDPSTGNLTLVNSLASIDMYQILSEGVTPKPVFSVPTVHPKKTDLTLTMPEEADVVYRPVVTDSTGVKLFSLTAGEVWKAGETYTIPGNVFSADDNYTLQFAAGKKRHSSVASDSYIIQVGTPDPREPIYFWCSMYRMKRAVRTLHDYGIITLDDPDNADFYTADRPSRLKMVSSSASPSLFFSTGDTYDYMFMTASEAKKIMDKYQVPLTLLIQQNGSDGTPADDLIGLYSPNKTLKDFCSELSIPVPDLEPHYLILPAGLKVIGEEAFMGDTRLKEVVLQEGVTKICRRAFAGSSLKKITLPASLSEDIPDDIFEGCGKVTVIAPEGSKAWEWASEKGLLP